MNVVRSADELIVNIGGKIRRILCKEELWRELVRKFIEIGGSVDGENLIIVDGDTREGLYLIGFIEGFSEPIPYGRRKCTPRMIGRHDCVKCLEKILTDEINAITKKQI